MQPEKLFQSQDHRNQGDATSIVVDPSCNEVLKVWSDDLLCLTVAKIAVDRVEEWILEAEF